MADEAFEYEELGEKHFALRRHFRCGEEALDIYLRSRRVLDERDQDLTVVRVIYDPARNRIAGYYTLSAFSVERDLLPGELTEGRSRYEDYPATLLGRLAVDLTYAGQGVGGRLLLDALKRSLDASALVASFAVVVDVKSERAATFYEKYGFQRLETESDERRYFLPMGAIRQLFSSLEPSPPTR